MNLVNLIYDYISSIFQINKKYPSHNFIIYVAIVLGSIFAGYTVTSLPHEFLKLFEHYIGQFFIIFLIFNIVDRKKGFPIIFIVFDAILFTVFIQLFLKLVNKFYKKKQETKETKETNAINETK